MKRKIGYWGETKDGKQHGTGTQIFANGHEYTGQWCEGKIHGEGIYKYPTGARYEGTFVQQLRHGTGTYASSTGDVYDGEWRDGKRTGVGTLFYGGRDSGESYSGGFLEGKRHGHGVYSFTSGDSYEGDWVSDMKHGKGQFRYANGDVFTGTWLADHPDGSGVFTVKGESVVCDYVDGRLIRRGSADVSGAQLDMDLPYQRRSSDAFTRKSSTGSAVQGMQPPAVVKASRTGQDACEEARARAADLLASCRAGLAMAIGDVPTVKGASVRVVQVKPDGPAHAAGVRRGDYVLQFLGKSCASKAEFLSAARALSPGDVASCVLRRGGEEHAVSMHVGTWLSREEYAFLVSAADAQTQLTADEAQRVQNMDLRTDIVTW